MQKTAQRPCMVCWHGLYLLDAGVETTGLKKKHRMGQGLESGETGAEQITKQITKCKSKRPVNPIKQVYRPLVQAGLKT